MKNGWYLCSPSYTGAPSGHAYIGYGTVLTIERASDSCIQVYWSDASPNITGSPLNLVRKCGGTTWSPWEWVNPPMALGVEYRTTERYNGKPVYIKAVYISALPNNAQKAVGLGVTQAIFRPISFGGNAVSSDGSLSYALPSSGNNIAVNDINLQIFGGSAYIKTNSDYSAYSAIVWVKYYKTTD